MGEKKGFLLRLDEVLLIDLKAWSEQELRSLNGQIEYALREAVKQRKKIKNDQENASESNLKKAS